MEDLPLEGAQGPGDLGSAPTGAERRQGDREAVDEVSPDVTEEGLDEDAASDLPLEGKVAPEGSDEVSSNEVSPDEGPSEKKSIFGKKNKKDPFKEKFEEMQDKYMRQVAEFDNFRKRTEKEKSQMFDNGAMHVLTKILPVIDNFERGFDMVEDADKDDAFVDGMNKVYKQLMTELENMGVTPIEALGKEFDPAIHNAVMQVESDEYDSGIVAQEMQKGYMYHDNVLRFSMVAVVS
ncbi:MAG: nucleotide exchange factor GrpE [Lachnospiraceae bacterium]|nr:nucleotide exchange factor GrpE [Lachnospiraceae bacterium]